MKKTITSLFATLVAGMFLFTATAAWAVNGVWNGTVNTAWTNSNNWSASPYPSGTDTASFTNAGNGQTTIDLSGLTSITYMTFDSPSVAAYTNGTGAANSQTLVLADNGIITLTDTAANSQLFNAGLQLGTTIAGSTYTLTNANTSQTLTFNNVFAPVGGATAGAKVLAVNGPGNTTILGNISRGGVTTLTLTHNSSGTLLISGSNVITVLTMNGGTNSVVDIGNGTLFLNNLGANVLNCNQGGKINGSGKIRLSTIEGVNSPGYNYADLNVAANKTLVINPEITGPGGFESNAGTGTFVLNGMNTFEGHVCLATASPVSVFKIGNRGSSDSNLGKGSIIYFGGTAKLIYTGTGETSDRQIILNNTSTIDQSGPSGKLTFSVSPSLLSSRTLNLQGSTAGIGEFTAPLVNSGANALSITKAGSGTWILSGTNTYTGATTVNGGKLLFNSPGNSSNSVVTVNKGAILGGDTLISGNVILTAGGMLAPKDIGSVGTLNLRGTLSLTSGTIIYDVSNVATDKVTVASALSLTGTNTVILSFPDGQIQAGSYTLMTFASLTGAGTFMLAPGYVNASLVTNATSLQLVVSGAGTTSKTWKGNVSGLWNTTEANWTNGSAAVNFVVGDAVLFDDTASTFNVGSEGSVQPGSVLFNNSNAYTVSAAMAGTAELVKLGAGSAILSGTNTFSGQTTIGAGTLTIGEAGVLGNGNYSTNIINNAALNYASAVAQTNSGVISGGGFLTSSGSGTLTLSGNNTYAGPTTITAGEVEIRHANALGATGEGTLVTSGGKLTLSGNIVTSGEALNLFGTLSSQIGSNTYAGAVSFQAGSVIDVGAGSTNILSVSTPNIGVNPFTKTGAGLLKLTQDPNHAGTMTINGGAVDIAGGTTDGDYVINTGATLIASVANAINDANTITINAGGFYDVRLSDTIKALFGAGTLTMGITGAPVLTVGGNNASGAFSGVIQDGLGMMGFAKIGTGVQILSGVNTYTGLTTVTTGTLSLRGPSALPALSAVSMNAATLQILQDGAGNNGTISVGNSITLNAGITATIDVGNNGSGNTGNTIAFGALNNGALGTAYQSTINFTGTNGYLQSFTSLGLSSLTGQGTTLRPTTTSVTILGTVTNRQASGGYDTLTLDGTSTGNSILGRISDAVHYTAQGNGDTRIIKSNTSTWTLAGVNTYRGDTTVNGGTLLINGSIVTNASVANGATLGGSGTIGGNVTAAAGGNLAPGGVNAIGTLSISGTLTLNGNLLLYDISNVTTDKVAVASALTLNGTNAVVLAFPGGEIQAGTYILMTFASSTGTGTFVLSPSYVNCSLVTNATSVALQVDGPAGYVSKTWRGNLSTSWDGADQNWVNGVVATNFATGDAVTFDDTAADFSVSSAASVAPVSVLFNNSANNYTVSAAIGGTGPLVMSGSGVATLSGTNTFSGPTTINFGTLTIGGAGLLGNGLYVTNIINNGTFNYASSAMQTNSGIISGAGALTVSGSGMLALSGVNTYTGPTVVNAGTLKIQNAAGLGTIAAGTTVAPGAKLELEGNITTPNETLTLNGTLSSQTGTNIYGGGVTLIAGTSIDVGSGSMLSLNGFQANGAYTKEGAGWLKLLVDPNGVGLMTINNGVAELGQAAGATESDIIINSGATLIGNSADAINRVNSVTVNAGGVYALRQSDTINMLSGDGTLTRDISGAATIGVGDYNGSSTFSGVIENGLGMMSFVKTGTGIQTLTGMNSYTGTTTVSGGTLLVNSPGSLSNSTVTVNAACTLGGNGSINGNVIMSTDGILAPGGMNASGTLTLGRSLTLNNSTLFFDVSSAVTDQVVVTGVLTNKGVNTIALSFPDGVLPANDYTLMTFSAKVDTGSFVLRGASPNASLVFVGNSLVLRVTGDGAAGLTWNGNLSAFWDGSDKNWKIGNLATNFAAGDAVTFDDTASSFSVISSGVVMPSSVFFNNNIDNPYFVLANMDGTAPLLKTGPGSATLSALSTYNPTSLTVNAGTLVLAGASQLNSGNYTVPIAINNGTFNHSSSAAQILSGVLSGAGSVVKAVSGSLTLSNANTYSGGTTVSAGTLYGANVSAFGTAGRTLSLGGGTLVLATDSSINALNTSLSATSTIQSDKATAGSPGITHTLGTLSIGNVTLNVRSGVKVIANSPYGLTFGATTLTGNTPTFDVANNGTGLGTLTLGALINNNNFNKANSGTLFLGTTSTRASGVATISGGTLKLGHASALGAAAATLTLNSGTILDLAIDASINAHPTTLGGSTTIQSGRATSSAGITHTLGTLSMGAYTLSVAPGANVSANSSYGLTFGAATLTGNAVFSVANNGTGLGTLTLGVVSGAFNLTKSGTGILALPGANTYSGTTTVTGGTLALSTANGALASSTAYTITSGGTLLLDNTATANNINRLRDASAITLDGGTLSFTNNGGAVSYYETAGALFVTNSGGTIVSAQAATGRTNILNLGALTRTGLAPLNFVATGLGESQRNRIFIVGQPNGLIGLWATINTTNYAAYDSSLGVIVAGSGVSFTNILAKGPSIIPDDPTLNAWINELGTGGGITLAAAVTNRIKTLVQNTDWQATTVAMTNQTLLVNEVLVSTGNARSLTLGTAVGEGAIAPLSAGGELLLTAAATNSLLTINAAISNNVTASRVTKQGLGTVILAGTNIFTGPLTVNNGVLSLTGSNALTTATVNIGAVAGNNAVVRLTPGSSLIGTTGNFTVGSIANGYGAFYLEGGRVVRAAPATIDGAFSFGSATGGYGYFNMSNGYLSSTRFQLGYNAVVGMGLARITGGIASFSEYIIFPRTSGSTAVLTIDGGSLYHTNATQNVALGYDGGRAELNMTGGLLDNTGKSLTVRQGNSGSVTGIVNLCSGTLIVDNFQNSAGTALLSFNGGLLKASASSAAFLPATLTGVYLNGPFGANAGGAKIDTAGKDITFVAPLRAPTGNGVTAISLTAQGSGYIGEPYVSIAGDGIGATAVANMADDGTGNGTYKVASVTVTTPGLNYTTATVSFLKGGATAVAPTVASVTLATTTPAGLTKLGSGTLTLSGTNTYVGATTISNGTVRLGIANALPTNSVVNVSGGIFDLGGFTVTNGAVNLISGAIINGSLNSAGLVKDGGGALNFNVTQTNPAPIIINGGTFSLGGAAGLYEGRVNGAFDLTTPNPQTAVRLCPTNAYMFFSSIGVSGGIWVDNSTYIYTGFIWNRSPTNETWTFCKSFDDSVMIKVDSTEVINKYNDWTVVTTANYVVTPGPHAFEVRMGQGTGGVGQAPDKTVPGAGFDRLGRSNSALCVPIIDPGNGSLLTLLNGKLADASTVELAANAMLDLGGTAQTLASLYGSGIVSNGALTVTGTISPAGTNVIGTLTAKANTILSGTLVVDVATDGTSDVLVVQGNLDLLTPTLEIVNLQGLSTIKVYTLATCSGTITGSFASTNLSDRWAVRNTVDGKVQLYYKSGTMVRIM